jgi:hypothetical protein
VANLDSSRSTHGRQRAHQRSKGDTVTSPAADDGNAAALPDYAPIPASARGHALNEQGYYVGHAERNLYWVTDGVYQAAFLTTRMEGSHALASQAMGWLLATQARLGMTGEACAALAALDDERAKSGEIGNARAVICLADGDPRGALAAVRDVLGSVHALTEDGSMLIASASGSQLGPLASGAGHGSS